MGGSDVNMSILKIARLGHPVLREKSPIIDAVDIGTRAVQQLVDDMIRTMHDYRGVGLAAPQVHRNVRLLIADGLPVGDRGRRHQREPLVLFNPEISRTGTDIIEEPERCLSLPGIRGMVPRAREIAIVGLDRHGGRVEIKADGRAARLFQHEMDHLDGALFLDRMSSLRSLTYVEDYADQTEIF